MRARGQDAAGRWYWRARATVEGVSVSRAGRYHRPEVRDWLIGLGLPAPASKAPAAPVIATVRDLLEVWLGSHVAQVALTDGTRANYRVAARRVVQEIGDAPVGALADGLLGVFVRRSLDRRAPATIRLDVTVARSAWTWARRLQLVPVREIPPVRVAGGPTGKRRHTPTPGQVAEVVAWLDQNGPRWRADAVRLLWSTGARRGELARATWADVDLAAGTWTLAGKTGPRTIPIVGETLAILQRRAAGGPDPASWVLGVRPSTMNGNVYKGILAAAQTSGHPPWTPHGLRRAAVDRLYRSGADPGLAAALLGHSPEVALRHYRRPSLEDLRAALEVARLGHLPAGQVVPLKGGGGT